MRSGCETLLNTQHATCRDEVGDKLLNTQHVHVGTRSPLRHSRHNDIPEFFSTGWVDDLIDEAVARSERPSDPACAYAPRIEQVEVTVEDERHVGRYQGHVIYVGDDLRGSIGVALQDFGALDLSSPHAHEQLRRALPQLGDVVLVQAGLACQRVVSEILWRYPDQLWEGPQGVQVSGHA